MDPFYPEGFQKLIAQPRYPLSKRQINTLKQLYNWRDSKAQELDESLHCVCPNATLVKLCLRKTEEGSATGETKVMKSCCDKWEKLLLMTVVEGNEEVVPLTKTLEIFDMSVGWVMPPDSDNEKSLLQCIALHPDNQNYDCHKATSHSLEFLSHSLSQDENCQVVVVSVQETKGEAAINSNVALCMEKVVQELKKEMSVFLQSSQNWHEDKMKKQNTIKKKKEYNK